MPTLDWVENYFFKLEGIILGIGSVRNHVVLLSEDNKVIMKPMNLWGQSLILHHRLRGKSTPNGTYSTKEICSSAKIHLVGLLSKPKSGPFRRDTLQIRY